MSSPNPKSSFVERSVSNKKGLLFSVGLDAKNSYNGAKSDDSAGSSFSDKKNASNKLTPKQLSNYELKSISDLQEQCFNSLLALDNSLVNNKAHDIIKDRKGFKTEQLEKTNETVNFIPIYLINQSKTKKESSKSDDDQSINSNTESKGKSKIEFTYSSKTDNLEISKKLNKYRANSNDIVKSYYQMYSLNNSLLKEELSSSDILQKACLPKDLLSFNHKSDSNSSSFLSQSNPNIIIDQNRSSEVAVATGSTRTLFEKTKDCIMPSIKSDETNFEEPQLKNLDLLIPSLDINSSNSINYDISQNLLSNCKSNSGGNPNLSNPSNTIIPISTSDPYYYQPISNNMIGAQNYYPGYYQSIPYQNIQYHYPHNQGQVIYPVSYPYINSANTYNPHNLNNMPMNLSYNYQISPQMPANPQQHTSIPLNHNQNYYGPLVQQSHYQNTNNLQQTSQMLELKQIETGKINILKAIRDQQECRNLQILIDKNPSICKTVILPQLLQYFVAFCSDPFGNYLVQKVMAKLQPEDFEQITQKLIETFKDLSLHNFGTRVVQRFLELASRVYLDKLKDSIQSYLYVLYKNQNGIHVITKFTLYSSSNQFVYDFLMNNLTTVCKNQEGCCMIQKILEGELTEQKLPLFEMIAANTLEYIVDKHANYVVQLALQMGSSRIIIAITNTFCSHDRLRSLCKQQYSSNVVEKCLDGSNSTIHSIIIESLINGFNLIGELLTDSFGNYVIQKALAIVKGKNYIEMLSKVSESMHLLSNISFGTKLAIKLQSIYPELKSVSFQPVMPEDKRKKNQVQSKKSSKQQQYAEDNQLNEADYNLGIKSGKFNGNNFYMNWASNNPVSSNIPDQLGNAKNSKYYMSNCSSNFKQAKPGREGFY